MFGNRMQQSARHHLCPLELVLVRKLRNKQTVLDEHNIRNKKTVLRGCDWELSLKPVLLSDTRECDIH